jgi:hypothetical protein
MSKYTLALVFASAALSTGAFGQTKPQEPSASQTAQKSQGVKIEGNTNIQATNVSINGFSHYTGKFDKHTASASKSEPRVEAKKKESGQPSGAPGNK